MSGNSWDSLQNWVLSFWFQICLPAKKGYTILRSSQMGVEERNAKTLLKQKKLVIGMVHAGIAGPISHIISNESLAPCGHG